METLNKNWFAFTLCAVVFGILGYLLGQQNAHNTHRQHSGSMMSGEHEMIWMDKEGMEHGNMMFFGDGDMEGNVTMDVQTDTTEDGEIRVMVRKMKVDED